jgi:signal transduction histidine kinase
MTPGTSPPMGESPSSAWAAAAATLGGAAAKLPAWLLEARRGGPRLARVASTLYLGALGIILTTAWHGSAAAAGDLGSGLPAWHLAVLMAAGTVGALLTLTGREREAGAEPMRSPLAASEGLSALMAQMSHELRTPLNAVIGFSDVMLHELHGPLGNARYQEYAHHISESGGRLLKSSEQALAITEAMTALMADRSRGRRERLVAGVMVREAWRNAAGETQTSLRVNTCNTCDVVCERRPTVQALEHLLREASAQARQGAAVEVTGQRQGGVRKLLIRTASQLAPSEGVSEREAGTGKLGVILARLLLETQGATLDCTSADGVWSAVIAFPAPR